MGAALLCVESSAATVGQQIHTYNTTDNYDLHHISRSHTTFQVSTLNCMIPNDIYRSHTTYQGSSLRLVIPHHIFGSHTTYQISSLRFMIPHNVSGSRPAFQVFTLQFVIPHQAANDNNAMLQCNFRAGNLCFGKRKVKSNWTERNASLQVNSLSPLMLDHETWVESIYGWMWQLGSGSWNIAWDDEV